jgi:IS5 family transposase
VILPKKGRLLKEEREYENSENFRELRRKHAAVESGINALENHGLDRCLDHGIIGFKRYVALAVLGRNLQNLGNIIQEKKKKLKKHEEEKHKRVA